MKIYSKDILKAILWASIEDYCGLWELVWEINSLNLNLPQKESQYAALQCMLYLTSKDFVRLFYCQEPYGKMTEIDDINSYPNLLHNSKAWAPPLPKARSIRVAATKAGERYYGDIT